MDTSNYVSKYGSDKESYQQKQARQKQQSQKSVKKTTTTPKS